MAGKNLRIKLLACPEAAEIPRFIRLLTAWVIPSPFCSVLATNMIPSMPSRCSNRLRLQSAIFWVIKLMAHRRSAITYRHRRQRTIPPQSNCKEPWSVDWYTYKERHLAECFFQQIKWSRRVFTRYDKLDTSFFAFVYIAATMVFLKKHI